MYRENTRNVILISKSDKMVGTDPGEYKSDKSKGLTYKNMLYFIGTERPWELEKLLRYYVWWE